MHSARQPKVTQSTSAHRSAAFALILGPIAGLTAIAFHPTGQDVLRSAAAGTYNVRTAAVHSLALAAQLLVLAGTLALALRLRVRRDLSLAAYIIFAAASFAVIIAGVASGFLAPGVLRGYAEADEPTRAVMLNALHYTGRINRTFAQVGATLSGIAILLWSVAMLLGRELSQSLAIFGTLLGVALALGIVTGYWQVNLLGFGIVVLAQGIWFVWVATLLWGSDD
ncbi:hypothetical protein BH23GEM9_BH23GEM9_29470 [soil metagenome]